MTTSSFAVHPRRPRGLSTLTEVSRALTYTTSIDDVLRLTVRRAAELVRAKKTLIMLADAAGLLNVRAAYGVDEQRVHDFREPLNETLARRLQGLLDHPSEEAFLGVPLVVQGKVTGLLAAVRMDGKPCTANDEWLLSALADQAAVALENARLVEAVREKSAAYMRLVEAQHHAHATLGHELRSPLTAVQGYSSLLLEGLFGSLTDRQRESIARIRMSGQHLLSVIENVLDKVHIDAGSITLSNRDVPVADVLAEAVQMLQPLAVARSQDVRIGATTLLVHADPNRLRQALVNLIGNAIKYTPRGGPIRVEVSTQDARGEPFASIAVIDSGPGVPPEVLARIFEPYNRGDAPDKAGLGLGLFISRELVRHMGGDIEVHSEPGRGSVFTTLIPLASDANVDPVDRDARG